MNQTAEKRKLLFLYRESTDNTARGRLTRIFHDLRVKPLNINNWTEHDMVRKYESMERDKSRYTESRVWELAYIILIALHFIVYYGYR